MLLRTRGGICENNKSSVALLSPMCCIGGILNKGHISILTPVPTTALDLKTFAGSYLPIDGSKHVENLRLFVSISDWFCLEIFCFPSSMVLVYRNEFHFKLLTFQTDKKVRMISIQVDVF